MPALPDFDQMWNYDQPAETEQRFRDLLPAAQESGHAEYVVELMTQIARTEGLQRKFAQAHQTLDEAESYLTDTMDRARIRCLLERGRVLNSSRNPAEAKPLFVEAWELALEAQEDFYAIDAAHMLGIVEPPEQQLEWNLRALELAENTSEPRAKKWLGSLYNNIGWTHHAAGRYDEALNVFQKALDWRLAQGQREPIRIARWCVARTLRSLGQIKQALDMQRALLDEYADTQDGYVYEELGECYLALNKPAEAEKYFALAYAELSKDIWLVENEPQRIQRLRELGKAN